MVARLTVLGVLITALSVTPHTQWTSYRSQPESVLEGAFTSCADNDDGTYGERVFVWKPGKVAVAEIHLGPRDEFAVFAGEVEEERDHRGSDNLLGPSFHFADVESRTGRNWAMASINLHLNVRRADGSYPECYSWWVLATTISKRTLAQ